MQEQILDALNQYAHNPALIYSIVFLIMYASSFGFPIPEELTLLTVGFIAHMSLNPENFPLPEGGQALNPHAAALVCFLAVVSSDLLVYFLGRTFGRRVLRFWFFKKIFTSERVDKVQAWTMKYGNWACGIFRLTPGLRFPGHLSCGMMHFPVWKFVVIDGLMAIITVPTQVYAVAYYGDEIFEVLKQFKIGVGAIIIIAIVYRLRHHFLKRLQKE